VLPAASVSRTVSVLGVSLLVVLAVLGAALL